MNVIELTPSEVYHFITVALRCKQVPYIGGPPAIGKSQVVHQVAKAANAKLIDTRLSQKLPEELSGFPEKNQETGKAVYIPFEEIPLEGDPVPEGYSGWIWFLDELSSATEEVLAAMYSAILDHMIGGRKIHPKCRIVAAGNLSTDSAIARELPDTLITRMLPCIMKVSHSDWLDWSVDFPDKSDAVIEFIKKNPKMLYAPTNPKDRQELETYPTPRGWEKAMAHVNFHEMTAKPKDEVDAAGVPTGKQIIAAEITDVIYHLMVAAVGPIAARTFKEDYDEAIQLPYPWEIAQSPASAKIPATQIGKAKLTTDLAKYFLDAGDDSTRNAILQYMNRIGGEFSVLFANEIESKLGSTNSDKLLVKKVQNRLQIDDLLGVAPKGGASDDPDRIPF